MDYDQYRAAGSPIGGGEVECGCGYVVGRRPKGNGMRWMRRDNGQVLRSRLARLYGYLHRHLEPTTPRSVTLSRTGEAPA
jgi:hypothetical protein